MPDEPAAAFVELFGFLSQQQCEALTVLAGADYGTMVQALVSEAGRVIAPSVPKKGESHSALAQRAGALLGARRFRRAVKCGELKAHRVGRELLAKRCDLNHYIEQYPVAAESESKLVVDPFDNALANGKLAPLKEDKQPWDAKRRAQSAKSKA